MSNKCSNCGECVKENVSGCVQESDKESDTGDMDKRQSDGESGLKGGE